MTRTAVPLYVIAKKSIPLNYDGTRADLECASQDICAKSPVVNQDSFPTRRSMDSTRFQRMPRQRLFEREPPSAVEEGEGEGFEEVGLNEDEPKPQVQQLQAQPVQPLPKKRGFFAKFSDHSQDNGGLSPIASPSPTSSRFSILPSRKRAQSIQGAELGQVDRPQTANCDDAKEMTDTPSQA